MCFAPQQRVLFRHLNFQKWSGPGVFCTSWLRNVLRATAACTFSISQLPKVRTWGVFSFFTCKCASRHNGAHFFDFSTAKSGPRPRCFVHFDFEMCFAPQRCNVSSLIWPAGSAPAPLASLLFDSPEPQTIGKTQCFATFLPFRAPGSSFFWDFLFCDLLSSSLLFSSPLLSSLLFSSLLFSSPLFSSLLFSSLTLPISAFHLSILSEVRLLNFLRQREIGSGWSNALINNNLSMEIAPGRIAAWRHVDPHNLRREFLAAMIFNISTIIFHLFVQIPQGIKWLSWSMGSMATVDALTILVWVIAHKHKGHGPAYQKQSQNTNVQLVHIGKPGWPATALRNSRIIQYVNDQWVSSEYDVPNSGTCIHLRGSCSTEPRTI